MKQPSPFSLAFASRLQVAQDKVLEWLQCGMAPRQLAFTLALGFAIGCIPVLGVTTVICALLALALRLNMPAIQAANWLAMPLQVVLLIPFLRLGQWLFRGEALAYTPRQLSIQIAAAPWHVVAQMSGLFGRGLLAWLITAAPALLLITLLLTPIIHRVLIYRDSRLTAIEAD